MSIARRLIRFKRAIARSQGHTSLLPDPPIQRQAHDARHSDRLSPGYASFPLFFERSLRR
jgi:hypothetical protein